jgi:hypothetical protein
VLLLPSHTGGDDVSGWGVDQVVLRPFQYPICQTFLSQADGPSAASDPAPLVPGYLWAMHDKGQHARECAAVIDGQQDRRSSVYWRNPLTRSATAAIDEMVVPVSERLLQSGVDPPCL